MLTIEEKIDFFKEYLLLQNNNYTDIMKETVYNYFFCLNTNYNIEDFNFLNNDKTIQSIEKSVEFLISKMIMLEDKDGLDNIINEYINNDIILKIQSKV